MSQKNVGKSVKKLKTKVKHLSP